MTIQQQKQNKISKNQKNKNNKTKITEWEQDQAAGVKKCFDTHWKDVLSTLGGTYLGNKNLGSVFSAQSKLYTVEFRSDKTFCLLTSLI